MSEYGPIDYTRKTFDCTYGRHALVHVKDGPTQGFDVNWLLPVAPTRLPNNYQPRHSFSSPRNGTVVWTDGGFAAITASGPYRYLAEGVSA